MKFSERMEGVKEGINKELKIFLDGKNAEAFELGMPGGFSETVQNIREFILRGGKRLRPILFCYGYDLAGGKDREEALKAAISLEFLHASLLIHDDVMDRDNIRHGGPSMNLKYEMDYGAKLGRADLQHFGYSMAICAGDMAFAWSYEALVKNNFEDKLKLRAISLISDVITTTAIGQMMDESLQVGNNFDEKDIVQTHEYKTAMITIAGPLQLGAIFAGASEKELKLITDFAVPLVIAYQIQDDILGIFGSTEKTGKPVGADLREGKKTLLVSYALGNAELRDKDFILSRLGNTDLTQADAAKIREIIKKTGALKHSEDKIVRLNQDFLDKLKDGENEFGDRYLPLRDFAGYLLKRKK